MAPDRPPIIIVRKVCTWVPMYTAEMAVSPRVPTMRLSAKPTAKVIRFCREMGMANVNSAR